jgi:TPR repeat protein/tRNA A-37 threonylcarbamoyl transferase component Bud32
VDDTVASVSGNVVQPSSPPGHPGALFGSYRLVRRLGRGGMGEVWLGEHVQIRRQVAIKLVLGELDPAAEARFLREAQATARIRHAGIVAVSDYGTRPGGGAYLVMELLEGETLAERLARGSLSSDVAIELALQISEALAAAHEAGVIHRDLKPANLFLVPDSTVRGGTRLKIVDFGVAKQSDVRAGDLETVTGSLMGTPLYMAPEQCTSSTGPVDARVDLYALGVVLYEMIAGRPPFQGPTLGDLLSQHLHAVPVPVRTLVPRTPPRLDTIVTRLLAKAREDRPTTASAVAVALRQVASRSSTLDVTASALDATAPAGPGMAASVGDPRAVDAKMPRSRRTPWIVVGLGVSTIVAVAIVALVSRREAPRLDHRTATLTELDAECDRKDGAACGERGRRELATATPDFVLAFRRLLAACDLQQRNACVRVALLYQAGTGVQPDASRARALVEAACRDGDGEGCTHAGTMTRDGVGGPADARAALERELRACELGDAGGCAAAGAGRTTGIGGSRDASAARALYAKAKQLAEVSCAASDARGCAVLGRLYLEARAGEPDPARAAMLLERACDGGERAACVLIADLYTKGQGVAKDLDRARAMLQRGCDGGSGESCVEWSVALAKGTLATVDAAKAVEVARHACDDLGDRFCTGLALMYRDGTHVAKDLARASSLFHRACAAGLPLACLATLSIDIPGVPRDEHADVAVLDRACELSEPLGCLGVGARHEAARHYDKAVAAYELACALSLQKEYGCDSLALLYFAGTGVPLDPDRGWKLLEDSCAGAGGRACRLLGTRLRDGTGRPANAAEALRVFERGCSMLNGLACVAAAELLTDRKYGLTADPARAAELRAKACTIKPEHCTP